MCENIFKYKTTLQTLFKTTLQTTLQTLFPHSNLQMYVSVFMFAAIIPEKSIKIKRKEWTNLHFKQNIC